MKHIKSRNLISILVIAVMASSIFALPMIDKNSSVYAASKTKVVKVTFNANGGKIGSSAKKVIKIAAGKKIGKKLPAASKMKRDGYKFKGWYTKSNSGKKISKKTKITKKTTYYAQWTRVLSASEKNLVGNWSYGSFVPGWWSPSTPGWETWNQGSTYWCSYQFKPDGTYFFAFGGSGSIISGYGWTTGLWSINSNGQIVVTNAIYNYRNQGNGPGSVFDRIDKAKVFNYRIGTDSDGKPALKIERVGGNLEGSYWHTKT